MNIWSAWSSREFQSLIESHFPGLLSRLEYLLPGLLGEEFLIDNLYTGASLQKIVEAFLPSDAFSSKQFRKECLNKLHPDELKNAASYTAVGNRSDFSLTRDAMANYPWKGDFSVRFVEFFDLPEHFLPAPEIDKPNSVAIMLLLIAPEDGKAIIV